MKKIIIILTLFVLVGCKSKKISLIPIEINTVKLALTEVDASQKNKAYEIGKRVLMTCNTSKFKAFTEDEVTASVIQNTTAESLSKTCRRFRQYYGTFLDLELIEIYKDNKAKTTIFRYKALYTKKVANKELRIFMNEENKVSSINSMDWVADFENK
jgi:hypothetical protein